jgi:hypothetical protein
MPHRRTSWKNIGPGREVVSGETHKYLHPVLLFAYLLGGISTNTFSHPVVPHFLTPKSKCLCCHLEMSMNFTPNNRYLQVGVNLGNIFTCAEPSSVTHSEDTTVSKVRGGIDAATRLALDQALVKAQRYLNMIQHDVSQHTQVVRVVEQVGSLLLNLKSLQPDQWGSLDRGVISNVLSLLYCCIMECYELLSTPLAISSPCDGLVACHLALQCVYGAGLVYVSGYYLALTA